MFNQTQINTDCQSQPQANKRGTQGLIDEGGLVKVAMSQQSQRQKLNC